MSDQPTETEPETTVSSAVEPEAPRTPVINGHLAQCEKCDEPAEPHTAVAQPTVAGRCASHATKTVEEWAREAGMLPEIVSGGQMQVNAHPMAQLARVALRRSSEVARRHNPKFRFFAAAKAMHRWPEGLRITKAEFDEAIEAADTGVAIR